MRSFTRTKQRSEVDIRVEQEIKNHRDVVYQMGQSIDSLKEGQIALSAQHNKLMTKSDSDLKTVLIAFENLKESVDSSLKKMDQRIGDIETQISTLSNSYLKLKKEMDESYVHQDDLVDIWGVIDTRTACIEQDLCVHKDGFNSAIVALNHKIKEELERTKKELTPPIPEVCPIQSKLNAAFITWKVDFEGLVKEIALLKKSAAYGEKKFENLYTLIDRLKGDVCHKQV